VTISQSGMDVGSDVFGMTTGDGGKVGTRI